MGLTTVVVVDDDPITISRHQRFFGARGLHVLIARSEDECLQVLESLQAASLFLIDELMPAVDAEFLLDRIRSHGFKHALLHRVMTVSGMTVEQKVVF